MGCARQAPPLEEAQTDRLGILATAYQDAKVQLKRPPRNLAELKRALPATVDAEDVLRSPRDGQPYVILYGVDSAAPITTEQIPLLAYEQQGSGGTRYAVTVMGITELSEDEFAAYRLPATVK